MIPVKAPSILDYGIAIYVPPLEDSSVSYVRCQIYYSKENPLFYWRVCDNTVKKLWEDVSAYSNTGILFLYKTLNSLDIGFYTIKIEAQFKNSNLRKGELTLGVSRENKYKLIIGMPFSIYPPITLS